MGLQEMARSASGTKKSHSTNKERICKFHAGCQLLLLWDWVPSSLTCRHHQSSSLEISSSLPQRRSQSNSWGGGRQSSQQHPIPQTYQPRKELTPSIQPVNEEPWLGQKWPKGNQPFIRRIWPWTWESPNFTKAKPEQLQSGTWLPPNLTACLEDLLLLLLLGYPNRH